MLETVNWAMVLSVITAIGTFVLIAIGLATHFSMKRANKNAEDSEFMRRIHKAVDDMKADNDAFRSEIRKFAERVEGSVERLAQRVSAIELEQARINGAMDVMTKREVQQPAKQSGEKDAES